MNLPLALSAAALACIVAVLLYGRGPAAGTTAGLVLRQGRGVALRPGEAWAAGPHFAPAPHPVVERLEWESPTRPFADWLVERREPVILANTLAAGWRATGRWSPRYLSQRLGSDTSDLILPVRRGATPVVQYYNHELRAKTEALHDDGLIDEAHRAPPRPPHPELMSMEVFWQQQQQQQQQQEQEEEEASGRGNYLHTSVPLFSQSPNRDLDELVRAEMRGLKLWTTPASSARAAATTQPSWQLWMGSAGVTSALHYDQQHNIYTQIHGMKRFLLAPPSAASAAHIFPRVHTCHRHSVLDMIGWPNPPETRTIAPPPPAPPPSAAAAAAAAAAAGGGSPQHGIEALEAILEPGAPHCT